MAGDARRDFEARAAIERAALAELSALAARTRAIAVAQRPAAVGGALARAARALADTEAAARRLDERAAAGNGSADAEWWALGASLRALAAAWMRAARWS